MTSVASRGRLLAGAALGFGLAMLAAQPAQAQCVVSPAATPVTGTVTCGTTTTTDTTNAGVSPAVDRNYNVSTSAGDVTATVSAGAVVDGFGLSFTNTVGGANEIFVVNNGSVQNNAGNATPVNGVDAALGVLAIGATNIDYSGTGTIANLSLTGLLGDGLSLQSSGTGNITANVGGNVSAVDPSSYAIFLNHTGTAGNISLTTATGTALSAALRGIDAEINAASAGTITITNNATIGSPAAALNTLDDGIRAFTNGTGAVSVTNNGAIGAAGDRLLQDGIEVSILNAASTAALSVSGTGAIFATTSGITANNTGTGTTTVNYTGAINTTGGPGISAASTSGALSVTAGAVTTTAGNAIDTTTTTGATTINANGVINANAGGISAGSTSGAITANVNSTVTAGANGVTLSSSGAKIVNVGATGNINSTGLNDITFNGGGTGTVNNSGTIGATNTGNAITTGTATVAINNNTGGVINGVVLLIGGGADTFTNSGTFNTAGVNDFGAGADVLTNNASGVINAGAGATFNGLETMTNAGTINAATGLLFDLGNTTLTNTGTLNLAGTLDLGAGTDVFANTGTGILNLTGNSTLSGAETFTQTGRINLNTFVLTGTGALTNSGFIDTSGNAGLGGFTSFNNAGTLDLAAGIFTVPAAVFTNTGIILADEGATTITGQTSFANSGTLDLQDGVANDTLTINSAFAGSGGSNLDIDFTGTAADRLVIVGAASGSTAVDAAYLGGGFNLDGLLVVDTVSSSANAFVLGAVTGETPLLDISLVQSGADYFLVAAPTAATFNPLVVPGFATDLWYQSADEIFAETVKPATTSGLSFWGEGYYSRDKYGDDDDSVVIDGLVFDVDNELKTKRYGLQLGVDYGFGGGRVGVSGGYAWADANGNADADLNAQGWNLGIYGQFGGLTGFHGEFLAKHDRYDAEFDNGAFDGQEFDIRSTGVDGSLGYRFGFGGAATMDIHAGLSHVRTKVDDISAFGFDYDIEKLTSTRGRAGVRAIFGGGWAPYVDGTVYHEFNGDGEVELFDGVTSYDLDTAGKGTWARLEAGLSGNDGPGPILAAWADLGDRKGFGVRAGWRLGGALVEAAPPPPPPPAYVPPPPPPPATQTCPDGSVILATDACPPPPPPPPPPPEPERG